MSELTSAHDFETDNSFLLQRVQPAMVGLVDGSLATLAPIFAVALATHNPHYAFVAGLASALAAGVSMAYSEGLSDTGELTGRGHPAIRGAITGVGTFVGGVLHTVPFLIPHYHAAMVAALAVVGLELLGLAWIRWRFFGANYLISLAWICFAATVIVTLSAALGAAA
jgi:erythrin-vacuolar iron transport family protein